MSVREHSTVSIGVPVHNGERFLEDALRSLLSQTFEDIEIIISDNASTDGTEEICRAVAGRDGRVRYWRNRVNVGAAQNFNQVFRLSQGRYFKWAAHDDVCDADLVLRCVELLDEEPSVVLAHARPRTIDHLGDIGDRHDAGPDVTSPDPATRFDRVMRQPFWATALFGVARADVLERTGLHGPTTAGDHTLLAELSLLGPFREVPGDLFLHRDYRARYLRNPSLGDRARHIDPTLPDNATVLRVQQVRGYLAAIARSPVGPGARRRCYRSVARWVLSRGASRVLRLDRPPADTGHETPAPSGDEGRRGAGHDGGPPGDVLRAGR